MIIRYFNTLMHLRLQQLYWRPYLYLRRYAYLRSHRLRYIWRLRSIAIAKSLELRTQSPFLGPMGWPETELGDYLHRAEQVRQLQFTFLNHKVEFPDSIDWHCPNLPQLWRYNLHYQSYLVDLGIAYCFAGQPQFYASFRDIVSDWFVSNPLPEGDAWHPYVVSLRVVSWVTAAHLFSRPLSQDPKFRDEFMTSLVEQVQYVFKNLEFDVGGNHLIANIKALCMAGAFFAGSVAERWLSKGLSMLTRELSRQVLPDGGHYERSPMYHSIVVEDLLMILASCRNAQVHYPEDLTTAVSRMVHFLTASLHPDGDIALFNDAAFGVSPAPSKLLKFANRLLDTPMPADCSLTDAKYALYVDFSTVSREYTSSETHLATFSPFGHTGYFIVRRAKNLLAVDAGPVCPDDLPAHAHADMFSYELSVRGQRWVVDSGVREYKPGPWRDYARSTRAHNTVAVANLNQVDVWGSFRVGWRTKPGNVRYQWSNGDFILLASHRAYRRFGIHTRVIADLTEEVWVVLDEVGGTKPVLVENFIHFHPEVQVQLCRQGAVVTQGSDTMWLQVLGADSLDLFAGASNPLNGWYMPRFGVSLPNPTLAIRNHSLPSVTAYVLSARDDLESFRLSVSNRKRSCIFSLGTSVVEIGWDTRERKPFLTRCKQ